jgi:hypothetical protein
MPIEKRVDNLILHSHTMEYYTAIKRTSHGYAWVSLIIQSNRKKQDIATMCFIISSICSSENDKRPQQI